MQDNYLIININVKTGLKDNFVKFENNQILLGVKSFPLHNKDNLEVINAILQFYQKFLNVIKKKLNIWPTLLAVTIKILLKFLRI